MSSTYHCDRGGFGSAVLCYAYHDFGSVISAAVVFVMNSVLPLLLYSRWMRSIVRDGFGDTVFATFVLTSDLPFLLCSWWI